MERFTYLLVITGAVLVPFLFSFHPRLRFYKNILSFFYANLITALLFILWDMYFTHIGVWQFNDRYVTGIYLNKLPLEEILFFIFIPYACLFSYHCFGIWKSEKFKAMHTTWFTVLLSLFLIVMSVLFIDRAYTMVTFILLAGFLLFLDFGYKPEWLGQFYFTYLVMLFPFFIVNGILTGTGLEEPVVIYNSNEIINLRMFTIPFEDVFYGMLLTGLNIFFYEFFLKRKAHSIPSDRAVPHRRDRELNIFNEEPKQS